MDSDGVLGRHSAVNRKGSAPAASGRQIAQSGGVARVNAGRDGLLARNIGFFGGAQCLNYAEMRESMSR